MCVFVLLRSLCGYAVGENDSNNMEAREIFREEMRVLSNCGQKKTVIGQGRNSSIHAGIIGRKGVNDASLL